MEERILLILEEAARYNLRNEVRYLAENLISLATNSHKREITNADDYYETALKTFIGTPPEIPVDTNRIYADSPEIHAAIFAIANSINVMDESINNEHVQTDVVFILTDDKCWPTWYLLSSMLQTIDSPILISDGPETLDKIAKIRPGSIVYFFGYSESAKYENIKNILIKRRDIINENITGITVLGERYQDKINNVSLIPCDNQDVLIDSFGFGKPDWNGKWSEINSIMLQKTNLYA